MLSLSSTEQTTLKGWIAEWKASPPRFVRQVFRATPDPWQDEVLGAFPHEPRIALIACSNPGKTAVLSWIGWNYLATRWDAQCAATAITGQNLESNLWKEIAYWYGRSPLLQETFELGARRISSRTRAETWFLDARTWNRDADERQQGATLAGLHSRHVLYLLDEAGGIPSAVARTAENALGGTHDEAHVVLGGNPIELSGPLYDAAVTHRSRWWVRQITGDPDDPARAPRVSIEWARDQIATYGRDDAYVEVYVLGKFPTGSTHALVSLDQFDAAFARWNGGASLADSPRTLGVDVARFGSDRSVVVRRAGDRVHEIRKADVWQGQDTEFTSGRVMEIADEWAGSHDAGRVMPIYVDDTGVGGGVTDKLLAAGYNAVPVVVGAGADGTTPDGREANEVHANLKSFLCADIQERFRSGRIALNPSIRETTTLVAEGSALRVGYVTGRRKVEGKDEYIKRTGRSTDFWDAMMLSFGDSQKPVMHSQGVFDYYAKLAREAKNA